MLLTDPFVKSFASETEVQDLIFLMEKSFLSYFMRCCLNQFKAGVADRSHTNGVNIEIPAKN